MELIDSWSLNILIASTVLEREGQMSQLTSRKMFGLLETSSLPSPPSLPLHPCSQTLPNESLGTRLAPLPQMKAREQG